MVSSERRAGIPKNFSKPFLSPQWHAISERRQTMSRDPKVSRSTPSPQKPSRQDNRDRAAKPESVNPVVDFAVELGTLVGRHLADEEKARRAASKPLSSE
jgi:hypothetical protein